MLPQKYNPQFKEFDINIHEPKNLLPVELHQHRKDAKRYNKRWEQFLDQNPSLSEEEILEKMREFNGIKH